MDNTKRIEEIEENLEEIRTKLNKVIVTLNNIIIWRRKLNELFKELVEKISIKDIIAKSKKGNE